MHRTLVVLGAVLVQLALVGVATFGQLSARLTGEEVVLRVGTLDPIDPFRGAYVTLGYPDLPQPDGRAWPGGEGDIFVPLAEAGDVWEGGTPTRTRPATGPYLTCSDRSWQLRCGIESWFAPQEEALALERAMLEGEIVARVRIDERGHAALVGLEDR